MPARKVVETQDQIAVQFVQGSLPSGEFVNGLPADGSTISVPATIAQAWIQAGVAKPANVSAAPAADVKEFD
jgi:hypothetical protein